MGTTRTYSGQAQGVDANVGTVYVDDTDTVAGLLIDKITVAGLLSKALVKGTGGNTLLLDAILTTDDTLTGDGTAANPLSVAFDHKVLVSETDATADYLSNKFESTTLTLSITVDATTGKQKLDVNVVNTGTGYPNGIEPFFPLAMLETLSGSLYLNSGTTNTAMTQGWTFIAPRSITASCLGIYLKGEPSPANCLTMELAIRDTSSKTVYKTEEKVVNVNNMPNLNSGGFYCFDLATPFAMVGGNFYTIYICLKTTDGTLLKDVSNFTFAQKSNTASDTIQVEAGLYLQYASQNYEAFTDTGGNKSVYRPYMTISE